ncbi:MAG TPA: transporter substrate-binding domain-containing protein, partial [Rubrivivax sp.]
MAAPFVLRYGGDRSFRPFEFLDDDGQPSGLQVELLGETARAGGFEVSIQLDDWPAIERGFRAGAYDAIAMVDIPARREWAQFLRSHATPEIGLYRRPTQPDPQSIGALAGHIVALHASPPLRDTRAAHLEGTGATLVETPSPLASLQWVQAGRADFALMPRAYGDRLLSMGVVGGVIAGSLALRLQSYAFAVAPGNTTLKQRLEAALEKVEASGRLEALRVKWLASHQTIATKSALQQRIVVQRVIGVGLIAGGTAAVAGLAVLLRRRTKLARAEREKRRQAEAELASAKARLSQAFSRHPDAMLVVTLDGGVVLDVNRAMCQLVGVEADSMLGQPLESLPVLAEPDNLRGLREVLDREGQFDTVPLRVRHADGHLRSCLVSCELLRAGGEAHALAVLRDVSGRLQSDDEARSGYEQLEARVAALGAELAAERDLRHEAQRSAERFTEVVARDLKAPLHAMRGAVGLMHKYIEAGELEKVQANADQIDDASRRMDGLVAALARIAQVERGEIRRQPVDMRAMAVAACNLARAQPGSLVNYVVEELPAAQADPGLVEQLWHQLIDNAWKFTRQSTDAKVRIDAFRDNGRDWYRVADNGSGFDLGRATRLFLPFQRLHGARAYE